MSFSVEHLRKNMHAIDAVLPEKAARVQTNRKVNETRERLVSTTGTKREFDIGLLKNYAENYRTASLGLTMVYILTVIAFVYTTMKSDNLPIHFVVGAGIALILIHLINIIASSSLLKLNFKEVDARKNTLKFTILQALNGLAWTALLPIIAIANVTPDSFLIFVALIVIAGLTMIASPLPKAVYAATLPIAIGLAAYFFLRDTVEGFLLACSALVAETFFMFVSHRFYKANLANLISRAERESLLADLEIAKITSDDARREAENANIAKSRFLAQMSHELRTPLNAILGFSEVIKDEMFGPVGTPSYVEYANDINSSGKHLLSLINEILDLSRIESGKQELSEEAVMLAYVGEEAAHLLRVRAKNKGIDLLENYEDEMPKIWVDERAIRQIMLNLMSNAIKFTPNAGSVTLTVGWTASGGQYLSVKDTGMGIPENEIEEVLSNFGQGSNAMKSAEAGTGLGLSIVQGLVKMHGGSFSLKSKVGVGTEVIATFPAERVIEGLSKIESPSIAAHKSQNSLTNTTQNAINRLSLRKKEPTHETL